MFKKWLARLIVPLLAIVALCPIAAPRAFAADPAWLEVYASGSGTVTVNGYTGDYVSQDSVGDWIEATAWPSQYAYFIGWYQDGVGYVSSSTNYAFTLTENTVLYAEFGQDTYTLTASVNDSAGGWINYYNSSGVAGDWVEVEAIANEGYYFDGWYDPYGNWVSSSADYGFSIYGDTSLVAHFYKNAPTYYTVYVESADYSMGSIGGNGQMAVPGDWLTVEAYPEMGYEFRGWTDKYSGAPVSPDASYSFPIYADTYLVANFDKKGAPRWVTTMPGEGSGWMPDYEVMSGEPFTLPDCTYTAPEGKVFAGWDVGDPGDVIVVNSDMTITAQWVDATFYLVFIDKNGATGYMEDPWIQEGKIYTVPESTYTPPEGKYFGGWYLEGAGVIQPGTTLLIDGDKTLVAQWEDIYCTVYIMPNGGDGWVPDPSFIYGTVYELPECPFTAPEGMEFKGWDMGQPGDKITLTTSITINALWAEKEKEVVSYSFASGNASSWKQDSTAALTFVVKRSKDDSTTFSHFTGSTSGVYVDGQKLASSDYTASAGSLRLTLQPAYLKTLSTGTHGLEIVFDDGHVTGSFTIAQAAAGPASGSASSASASASSASASGSGSATSPNANGGTQKADSELPIIPILLGIIAAALIAIFVLLLVRRKKDDDSSRATHYRR